MITQRYGLQARHFIPAGRVKYLQKLYGSSNRKDNRFAYMAFLAKDKPAVQEVLARIGDAWDPRA